jgi:hypothetical protein
MIVLRILEDYPEFVGIINGNLRNVSLRKDDVIGGLAFAQCRNLINKGVAEIIKSK